MMSLKLRFKETPQNFHVSFIQQTLKSCPTDLQYI